MNQLKMSEKQFSEMYIISLLLHCHHHNNIYYTIYLLDKRCDGFIDCEDSTDESYCAENVEIDQSYDKLKVFKLDRTKINCYFNLTILDVISIDDCDNVFKAKFKIEIEWKDIRLKFRHAKKGLEVLLSNEEVNQLWMPNILMDDINQMNRFRNSNIATTHKIFLELTKNIFSCKP